MDFSDLHLSDDVLRAVAEAGYREPTPIQAQAIPHVLMGKDVLGCAQTGTGKTASFVLPMLDILAAGRAKARMPRSLILEPTRELAAQVQENFAVYGKYHKLTTALLIGGESMADQERTLMRGVDVLIATPGRLLDLFERGHILLSDVKLLVIDEADRMLDMGFMPDVERIVSLLPWTRQTLFFSATMPPEIRRLADKFLTSPKEVTVSRPATTAETVAHFVLPVPAGKKRETLRDVLRREDVKSALVFCNRKREVAVLGQALARYGFSAAALHGDMAQSLRMETLDRFKRGEVKILVASDVAARGLDIDDMSHVFNFDVPYNPEDYVHRIGRTGRAGKSGRAITLVTADDAKSITAIEKLIKTRIPRLDAADGAHEEPTDTMDTAAEPVSPRRRKGKKQDRPAAPQPARDKPVRERAGPLPQPSQEEEADRPGPHGGKAPVRGLGDHVPAFLLRPVRRRA